MACQPFLTLTGVCHAKNSSRPSCDSFPSSFVFAQEKPFKEPISSVESIAYPQTTESIHRQADAIRAKNAQVANSHKKAKRDPKVRRARQEVRDVRAYADEDKQSAREAEKSAEYARERVQELKK